MSRIVLATLGSLGDLHPLLGIAIELRRRGHDPVICASASYQRKAESIGLGFYPLRPDATPESPESARMVREIMDPMKGVEKLLRGLVFPHLRETHADLMAAMMDGRRAD